LIHAETVTFEVRASEVASPSPDDLLTLDGQTRSGAIPTGSCGCSMRGGREPGAA
jgi:hypothetical protein